MFFGELFSSRSSHAPAPSGGSYISSSNVAPLNSTASGRTTSEWLKAHPSKRVCCVDYLWHPLGSKDSEYLETVRLADQARASRNKRHVDQLVSLEEKLLHLAETETCLKDSISNLKRQSQTFKGQAAAYTASSSEMEYRLGMNGAVACCEEQLRATTQQYTELREQQALLAGRSSREQQVAFEVAVPKNPYQTQSRWFAQDHLWDMHTALWIMLPPDSNIIIEFSFEGLFVCDGLEAAERIKYFNSAGIDFTIPEGHQTLVYDVLCDYIDAVKDDSYHWLTGNCQHFAGELYTNLVRGQRYIHEWHKCKDFLFKRMSDRWRSDWGKPSGDPLQYGKELEWIPWQYHELWPPRKLSQ